MNLDDMQRSVVRLLLGGLATRGSILGLPMGTGKSRIAVAVGMQYLRRWAKSTPWLVIMASSNLFGQWTRDIECVYPGMRVFTYSGKKDLAELDQLRNNHATEEVVVLMTHFAVNASLQKLPRPGHAPGCLPIGLVVIDEVHQMVNGECDHVIAVRKWLPIRKLGITGTPFHSSRPEVEMQGYRALVDPTSTKKTTPLPYHLLWIEQVPTVLLPPVHREYRFLAPTAEERAGYEALLDAMKKSYDIWQQKRKTFGDHHEDVKALRQRYVYRTACVRVYSANVETKLKSIAERVLEHPAQDRVMVYCSFVEPLRRVQQLLEDSRPAFLYHGGLSEKERTEVLQKVRETAGSCLLTSIRAGGTGLNLEMINLMLPIDSTPSQEEENQAIGRMVRRTCTDPKRVVNYMMVGMYDTAMRYKVWPEKELAIWRLQQGRKQPEENYGTVYAALKLFDPTLTQWNAFCKKRPASDDAFHVELKRCKC